MLKAQGGDPTIFRSCHARGHMLDGFTKTEFAAPNNAGRPLVHDVYTKGDGPILLLIQELPGIGPETLELADRFVGRGFRVVMPHLFGPLGKLSVVPNLVRVMCMRREWAVLASHRSSPISTWLRALCRHLKEQYEVPGVGVLGMCLTGNFGLSLLVDDAVLAGVASQPSMPLHRQEALHMSAEDVVTIRRRLEDLPPAMAFRFEKDVLCRAAKFEAFESAFNGDRERVKLTTLPGLGHSVLTLDFVDEDGHPTREAFESVVGYFNEALAGSALG